MSSKKNILEIAKESFNNQGNAVLALTSQLTKDFEYVVSDIHQSKGRVIVSGIGKSAIIGMKIVATLNSTGTPSIFMHAAEAIHGDLGVVQKDDILILISKSGNTPEIKNLLPFLKQRSIKIASITSNKDSFLAKNSNYFINCFIEKEACINNLAPTTSTTAQLVIGDALAICLSYLNGFNENDFAKHHTGGILGKKLYLKVSDILDKNFPVVEKEKLTLTVPINQQSKLRPISSINQINKCISILKTKPKIKRTMWSRRAQEYDQKINSGKIKRISNY